MRLHRDWAHASLRDSVAYIARLAYVVPELPMARFTRGFLPTRRSAEFQGRTSKTMLRNARPDDTANDLVILLRKSPPLFDLNLSSGFSAGKIVLYIFRNRLFSNLFVAK